jgi:hypothetical protein
MIASVTIVNRWRWRTVAVEQLERVARPPSQMKEGTAHHKGIVVHHIIPPFPKLRIKRQGEGSMLNPVCPQRAQPPDRDRTPMQVPENHPALSLATATLEKRHIQIGDLPSQRKK